MRVEIDERRRWSARPTRSARSRCVPAGAGRAHRPRGGIVCCGTTDPNPERVIARRRCSAPTPTANVGDTLRRRHHRRARLRLRQLQARCRPPRRPCIAAACSREVTTGRPRQRAGGRHLQRGEPRPDRPAGQVRRGWREEIVHNLAARPTSSALEEVQDNNGATDDGTVAARRRPWPGSSPRSARPAARRTSCAADRPGQRRRRRRAGRQHPGRSSCSAPTAGWPSSTGRRRRPTDRGTAASAAGSRT